MYMYMYIYTKTIHLDESSTKVSQLLLLKNFSFLSQYIGLNEKVAGVSNLYSFFNLKYFLVRHCLMACSR